MKSVFDRANLFDQRLEAVVAHGGEGKVLVRRVLEESHVRGALNFVDFARVPPGVSIGRHRHADNEEEYYLLLSGAGTMIREGKRIEMRPGDLVRTPPGAEHSFSATGGVSAELFVFEVAVPGGRR